MKFGTVFAIIFSAAPAVFSLTVNTPSNVVECEPTLFAWSGGTAPYFLTLVPGGQSMAAPIKSFPTQTGTSYTWLADLQANTIFNIALKDSTGATAYSDIVTIQPGSSAGCVNTAVNEGGTATGSGSSSPTAASSASGTSSSTSSGSPSATSSSATAQKTGGAASLSVSSALGVAGVMGLVGAALF